ncbi:MAG: TonB family protein [Bacteroidetes bacterium]|nr:TonB family protein [Bacteroidota bacterium]MBU1373502.1 TonB family protein [Bacteroidota bacterium]MBU1485260.1 TonB family protein [Bacteroidota bacterium]MBU1760686.1 TonB family protein [Bacteroidota bacterium]MBU2047300.1 TonB family protein [Bacteroidota bacterium]
MSKLDILNQDWIDIVFKGRNKDYGAYQLRKENNNTTNKAVIIGCLLFSIAIAAPLIIKFLSGFVPDQNDKLKQTEVVLAAPPPVDKNTPPPPPPVEPPPPKVDQVKFPPPVVKPDNEVVEEPPTVEELKKADPGEKTIKGDPNADIIINTPVGDGPVNQEKTEDTNQIFTNVEVLPTFPGGLEQFGKFLSKNLRYPPIARDNGIQGRVFCNFVVEKDGSLTDIKVVRGIGGGCDEEAVRVLKSSPKWNPGVQNGRNVRVSYTIPIFFQLQQ